MIKALNPKKVESLLLLSYLLIALNLWSFLTRVTCYSIQAHRLSQSLWNPLYFPKDEVIVSTVKISLYIHIHVKMERELN